MLTLVIANVSPEPLFHREQVYRYISCCRRRRLLRPKRRGGGLGQTGRAEEDFRGLTESGGAHPVNGGVQV